MGVERFKTLQRRSSRMVPSSEATQRLHEILDQGKTKLSKLGWLQKAEDWLSSQ